MLVWRSENFSERNKFQLDKSRLYRLTTRVWIIIIITVIFTTIAMRIVTGYKRKWQQWDYHLIRQHKQNWHCPRKCIIIIIITIKITILLIIFIMVVTVSRVSVNQFSGQRCVLSLSLWLKVQEVLVVGVCGDWGYIHTASLSTHILKFCLDWISLQISKHS